MSTGAGGVPCICVHTRNGEQDATQRKERNIAGRKSFMVSFGPEHQPTEDIACKQAESKCSALWNSSTLRQCVTLQYSSRAPNPSFRHKVEPRESTVPDRCR